MRDDLRINGYAVVDGIVDETDLDVMRACVARLEDMAGRRRSSGDGFVLEAPDVGGWVAWQQGLPPASGVLRSVDGAHRHCPELTGIAETVAKTHIVPATGTDVDVVNTFLWAKPAKVGSEKPWHQDMAFAPDGFHDRYANVVTAWIAVDPATTENGCLQFVPGSHRLGVLPHVGDPERADGDPPRERAVEPHVEPATVATLGTPVHAPLDPGAGAVFDGLMVHRSAPNTSAAPRRALSFVFALHRR
ncbi:phytanoyl-CoA dioxygenase family protein [Micromonospora sp. WMMA1949]|uniref:phytanoyl-CoA dioxygenase family protein n=1 Tax=Micromonospora sp. WMMA1949 TaxID=3015162 RepID=UPI0022B65A41|nr:phytanoyl-CoA dioxygenase family protein [Micromonospora sp. WMMA1949]MCZ7428742.1 phytanoyl-CoA dioxygenase family protein [Micromonospora sp. WMMA1949]